MLKKTFFKIIRTLKKLVIDIAIKILNRIRFSINSFNGSSREISLLYEYSDYNLPNQDFCNLISEIYYQPLHLNYVFYPYVLIVISYLRQNNL